MPIKNVLFVNVLAKLLRMWSACGMNFVGMCKKSTDTRSFAHIKKRKGAPPVADFFIISHRPQGP